MRVNDIINPSPAHRHTYSPICFHLSRLTRDFHHNCVQSFNIHFPESTGFHGTERQHIRQAAEQAGAIYQGDLPRGQTTHLACRSVSLAKKGDKYRRAAQWGIPAVSWLWVQRSTLAGARLPLGGFYNDAPAEAASRCSQDPGSGSAAPRACSSPGEIPMDQRRPAEQENTDQAVLELQVKNRSAPADGILQHAWGSGLAWGKENAGKSGTAPTINTLPPPSQLPQPQLAASNSIPAAVAAGIANITMAVSDISLRGSCPPAASTSGMRPDSCSHHSSSEKVGEPWSPCSGGESPELDVQCGQRSPAPSIQCLPSPPGRVCPQPEASTTVQLPFET